MPGSVRKMMSPPRPPSPPEGPPNGTNFSRRKAIEPFPPLPASSVTSHESTNFIGAPRDVLAAAHEGVQAGGRERSPSPAAALGGGGCFSPIAAAGGVGLPFG